jgi:16S rRNA (adenine1518-N6/adenine1519-N6)-dimethyltransferase
LGVVLQARASVQRLFTVAPGAFWPVPKVQSAVVRVVPRSFLREMEADLPTVHDPRALSEVAARAFSQRRKTLHNALERHYPGLDLAELGIDAGARPQTLSVAEFIRIANHLTAPGDLC